ncbi:MAG: hypothetical protein GY711_09895 [bacterium]|nr:hypothetical protein [bacterium]
MNRINPAGLACAAFGLTALAQAQVPLLLNEIYASHVGTDDQEYVELLGPPGMPLDGFFVLVVEGEGGGAGTLDRVWDLNGQVMPPDGFFVLGGAAVPNVDLVLGNTNLIENGTETLYLVQEPTGQIPALLGTDVSNGPNTTVIPGLANVADLVAMIDQGVFAGTDVVYDGAIAIGPDANFFPAGIYRGLDAPNDWCGGSFLDFDDVGNANQPRTPGGPNVPCVPNSFHYNGLLHTTLGSAGMAVDNTSGRLVVSNIGSSGCDGVSIDLGESTGTTLGEIELPLTLPPPGPCGITAVGSLQGAVQPVSGLSVNPVGGPVPMNQLRADFSPLGSPTSSIELFLGGQLVFQQPQSPGPIFSPPPTCVANCGPFRDTITIDVAFPQGPIPITIPGGPTVQADAIRFLPDNPQVLPDDIRVLDLLGTDIPRVAIGDEALGYFGNNHRALGEAQLRAGHDHLTISNIGSSGKDGVSIDLGIEHEDIGFVAELDPVDLTVAGSGFSAEAFGSFAGNPGSSLGSAAYNNNGGTVQASADFSPLGASMVRTEYYLNSQFQGSTELPQGLLGDVLPGPGGPPLIVGCGKLPPDPPCFVILIDRPAFFLPNGGTAQFPFDCIRILAIDAPSPIDSLTDLWLRGTDIPDLVITGEHDSGRFEGFQHNSTGTARLDASGGTLTVSNIGSSGLDGVRIDIGELTDVFRVEAGMPVMPPPPGISCLTTATGQLLGAPSPGDLSSLGGVVLPTGDVQIEPNFLPLGSQTNTVELFLQGQLVFQQSGLSGPGCIFPPPPTCVSTCGCPPGGPFFIGLEFPLPLPVQIPGGPTILADGLVMTPDNPSQQVEVVTGFKSGGLCPTSAVWFDNPFICILDELAKIFGNFHSSLGDADTSYSRDHLTVSNIGSSGCDGVSIDLGETTEGFSAVLEPVDLSTDGNAIVVEASGSFGGVLNSPLGSAGCSNSGGQIRAFADFSAIGSSTVRIEVFNQGNFVGAGVVQGGGPVAVVTAGPTAFPSIIGCGKLPPDPPCFFVDLDNLGTITPLGLGPLVGDQMRLLANNPSAPIDFLSEFRVLGTNLPSLVIRGEEFFPPTLGTPYCGPAVVHSGGTSGKIFATGSLVVANNNLTLHAFDLPLNQFGFLLVSRNQGILMPPQSDGTFCLGANIGRYQGNVMNSGATGTMSFQPNLGAIPINPPAAAMAGESWNWQWWFRDNPTNNLTNGLNTVFQ